MEPSEPCDQSHTTLLDGFVWVRADDTAGDGTEETDAGTKSTNWFSLEVILGSLRRCIHTHSSIPSSCGSIVVIGEKLCVRWLEVATLSRLHDDKWCIRVNRARVSCARVGSTIAANVWGAVGNLDIISHFSLTTQSFWMLDESKQVSKLEAGVVAVISRVWRES